MSRQMTADVLTCDAADQPTRAEEQHRYERASEHQLGTISSCTRRWIDEWSDDNQLDWHGARHSALIRCRSALKMTGSYTRRHSMEKIQIGPSDGRSEHAPEHRPAASAAGLGQRAGDGGGAGAAAHGHRRPRRDAARAPHHRAPARVRRGIQGCAQPAGGVRRPAAVAGPRAAHSLWRQRARAGLGGQQQRGAHGRLPVPLRLISATSGRAGLSGRGGCAEQRRRRLFRQP